MNRLLPIALRALVTVASALVLVAATPSVDQSWLAWFGFVPFLFVVTSPSVKRPFLWGWLWGLVGNGGGFYWINSLLERFGHLPLVASAPIYLLLVGYQGLAFGLWAWLVRRLHDQLAPREGDAKRAWWSVFSSVTWLAPLCMVAVELAMPFIFPFYLAITQARVPSVIQVADLTGPLGVTFLVLLVNGALFDAVQAALRRVPVGEWPWRRLGVALGVVVFALVYGQVRIRQVDAKRAAAPHVTVGLVQANIGIEEKWAPGLRESNLVAHQRISRRLVDEGAELIVWPESSYPYAFRRDARSDHTDGRQVERGFRAPIVFGAVTIGGDAPYPFNSALAMTADGEIVGRFDKNFLLVFGEYIPYYEHLKWLRDVIPEMSNFARGSEVTTFPLTLSDGRQLRVGPMICYEDIIPSFGRRLVNSDPAPNLLVNITNDAWFGATTEPYEHLALAVFRAVESRMDLVRAVNTGSSAIVDAAGRIVAKTKAVDPDEVRAREGRDEVLPEPLVGKVALLAPSGLYRHVGDLFGGLVLLLVLALGVVALGRAGRPVAWREVGLAAATVLGALVVGALVAGPSHLGLAFALVTHVPVGAEGETLQALKVTGVLVLFGALGSIGAGLVVGLRQRRAARAAATPLPKQIDTRRRLEAAAGAMAILVVPAVTIGRIEGSTASVVLAALGGVGLAALAARFSSLRTAAPATPPSTTAPAATEEPAEAPPPDDDGGRGRGRRGGRARR